jgi:hypothetical protein
MAAWSKVLYSEVKPILHDVASKNGFVEALENTIGERKRKPFAPHLRG